LDSSTLIIVSYSSRDQSKIVAEFTCNTKKNEPTPKSSGAPLSFFLGSIAATTESTGADNTVVDIGSTPEQINIAESAKENILEEDTSFEENAQETQEYQHRYQPYPKTLSASQATSRCAADYTDYKAPTTPESSEPTTTTKRTPSTIATTPVLGEDMISDTEVSCQILHDERLSNSHPDTDEERDKRILAHSWRRLLQRTSEEKWRRKHELLLIDRKKENIEIERQNLEAERQQLAYLRLSIDQQKAELENTKTELQSTLPLARQLQTMNVDVSNFIPWSESIHEYAQQYNTNLTTAAFELVKNLRAYKELQTLENSIDRAQEQFQQLQIQKQQVEQQLAMLHMSTIKYQNTIAALNDLQAAGFSISQIAELTGLVSMWNKIGAGTGRLNVFGENGRSSKNNGIVRANHHLK
jgi:hypothetical protein